jgi:hypothetical protein
MLEGCGIMRGHAQRPWIQVWRKRHAVRLSSLPSALLAFALGITGEDIFKHCRVDAEIGMP